MSTQDQIEVKRQEYFAKQAEILQKQIEINPLLGELQQIQNELDGLNLQVQLEGLQTN